MSGLGRGRGWGRGKIPTSTELREEESDENKPEAPAVLLRRYGLGRGIRQPSVGIAEEFKFPEVVDEEEMILVAETTEKLVTVPKEDGIEDLVYSTSTLRLGRGRGRGKPILETVYPGEKEGTKQEWEKDATLSPPAVVQETEEIQKSEAPSSFTAALETPSTSRNIQGDKQLHQEVVGSRSRAYSLAGIPSESDTKRENKFEALRREYEGTGLKGHYYNVLMIPCFHQSGNVLFSEAYTQSTTAQMHPENANEVDVYDLPNVETWLMHSVSSEQNELITDFLSYCLGNLSRSERHWQPYTVERIPSSKLGTADSKVKCHILRCSSPSDFHVIFQQEVPWFKAEFDNQPWMHFFQRREKALMKERNLYTNENALKEQVYLKYCFQSPVEAYHGISILLQRFLETFEASFSGESADKVELLAGDLVIVPKHQEGDHRRAYRGVILEPVLVMEDEYAEPMNAFLVYLLDTGECRVVIRSQLFQLPREFIGFRPLAVHCSLSGLQDMECTESVNIRFQELVNPYHEAPSYQPFILAISRGSRQQSVPQEIMHSRTLLILQELAYSDPYKVKMYQEISGGNSTKISTILVQENLANPAYSSSDDSFISSSSEHSLPAAVQVTNFEEEFMKRLQKLKKKN